MSKSKRKRTESDASLNASHTSPPKKRKFNAPRIINQKKFKAETPKNTTWKCIECGAINMQIYVFCSKCAAEPPFAIKSTLKPMNRKHKKGFKPLEPLFDRSNHNINHNHNDILMDDICTNNKNSNRHNHNIKHENCNSNNKQTNEMIIAGYPDYEIQFKYVANLSTRKYAEYLEKNIRREQNYHIKEFNEYLARLKETQTNDYKEFMKQFGYQINGIHRDKETNEMAIKMKMNGNNSNNKCHLGTLAVGTSILAMCQCHFDTITDINYYFERAIHGMIEEIPKQTNGYQFKITVSSDKMDTLKPYKNNKNNNNSKENDNTNKDSLLSIPIREFDFMHDTVNCAWILCVNNLGYYAKQLKHVDIFVNATKYQMPHKIFDYIYNCDIEWMNCNKTANDLLFTQYVQQIQQTYHMLNDSQQSAIARALMYPMTLIKGPPGTGKTYTLSYLCQFILHNKSFKNDDEIIVITAHSHSACDQILDTLVHIMDHKHKHRITRFGSIHKIQAHVKKYSFKILLRQNSQYGEYTKLKKNGLDDMAKDKLMKIARNILMDDIDIVITTCYGCSSQYLMNNNVAVSHLIIDEATQIVESELLIALNLLRDKRAYVDTNTNGKITNYYSAMPPHCESLKPLINGTNDWEHGIDLNDFTKRIVLIGDPKQLSPVVQSMEAMRNGFSISMFQRLLGLHSIKSINDTIRRIERERRQSRRDESTNNKIKQNEMIGFKTANQVLKNAPEFKEKEEKMQKIINEKKESEALYQQLKLQQTENNNVMNFTLLNVQYRMKEFMMRFCNEIFYDSRIKTYMKKNDEMKHIIHGIDWKMDDNKSVLFVSLDYSQQARTNTLSYYNLDECEYINNIISDVLIHNNNNNNKLFQIKGKDIGIIAMHKAQVIKMRNVLCTNNKVLTKDIEISTVDGFQGKEKKLIILSFVRTDNTSTSFLANAQRCNVALTRAKYGLIVIGQLQQLKANKMWRKFAQFVEKNDVVKVVHNNNNNNNSQ